MNNFWIFILCVFIVSLGGILFRIYCDWKADRKRKLFNEYDFDQETPMSFFKRDEK